MAKITRKLMKIFGVNAGPQQRGVFGSLADGTPAYSDDPETIQSLAIYESGWFSAILGNNSPAIQDMNALQFVYAYQLAYLFQAGIAEWNAQTSYYIGSLVQSAGIVYCSLIDDNLNQAVSDNTKWRLVGGNVITTLGDIGYGGTAGAWTRLAGNTATSKKYLTQTGTGSASAAPSWVAPTIPTVQRFTSGSGTYTTPAGVLYIRVRMAGGGGGGGSAGNSSGSASTVGTASTFGTSLLTANGGTNGLRAGNSVAGGSVTVNSPAINVASQTGGASGGSGGFGDASSSVSGGQGGTNPFGGGAPNGSPNAVGVNGQANTGGGGGGAGANGAINSGAGGGAGGYIDAIIPNPSATYAYAVGTGGTGEVAAGGGSARAGGDGGSGVIIVEEYYA